MKIIEGKKYYNTNEIVNKVKNKYSDLSLYYWIHKLKIPKANLLKIGQEVFYSEDMVKKILEYFKNKDRIVECFNQAKKYRKLNSEFIKKYSKRYNK